MSRRAFLLTALALAVLAGGLRFARLGSWPFAGDELGTFKEVALFVGQREAEAGSGDDKVPGMIPVAMLAHAAGGNLFGRDEFGARVLPALFGTALVVVVFVGLVRPLGCAAALMTALLLALSPEHLFHSQYHRYYNLAALLAALSLLAGAAAVERGSGRWALLASLAALALLLAHTIQGVLLVGLFAGTLVSFRAAGRPIIWRVPAIVAAAGGLAGLLLVGYLLPLGRDKLHAESGWRGYGVFRAVASSVLQVGVPVLLLAVLGALLLRRERRGAAAYWSTQALLWLGVSVVLPLVLPFHTEYVFPLMLGPFVLAGAAAGHVLTRLWQEQRLAAGVWVVVVCGLGLPRLVSYYADGNRPDYRTAARFVAEHQRPGDRMASVAPGMLRHYEPGLPRGAILPLDAPAANLRRLSRESGRLWIILQAGRTGWDDETQDWLGHHCSLELLVRSRRFDYSEFVVGVFLYSGEKD